MHKTAAILSYIYLSILRYLAILVLRYLVPVPWYLRYKFDYQGSVLMPKATRRAA